MVSKFRFIRKSNKTCGIQTKLGSEFNGSDEQFIKSFTKTYSDPMPPSWMLLEISSFGNLSHMYENLKPGLDKRRIANDFGLDETTFSSWLHCIVYIRNVCAHHSRLWNREMGISPKIPLTPSNPWIKTTTLKHSITGKDYCINKKVYYVLSMVIYLLNTVNPKHTFKAKFLRLLTAYPSVDLKSMGFTPNWENEPLWKNK